MNEDTPYTKVTWLNETKVAEDTTLSISERSGIVKVRVNKFTGSFYADDILTILDAAEAIKAYLAQHSGIARNRKAKKQAQLLNKTAEMLAQLTPEMREALLASLNLKTA